VCIYSPGLGTWTLLDCLFEAIHSQRCLFLGKILDWILDLHGIWKDAFSTSIGEVIKWQKNTNGKSKSMRKGESFKRNSSITRGKAMPKSSWKSLIIFKTLSRTSDQISRGDFITDIVIYTYRAMLEHSKGADGGQKYSWHQWRSPEHFNVGDRIYFASEGYVQGYFICEELNPGQRETIVWDKNSWHELEEKIPTRNFRGFKYRWWGMK